MHSLTHTHIHLHRYSYRNLTINPITFETPLLSMLLSVINKLQKRLNLLNLLVVFLSINVYINSVCMCVNVVASQVELKSKHSMLYNRLLLWRVRIKKKNKFFTLLLQKEKAAYAVYTTKTARVVYTRTQRR